MAETTNIAKIAELVSSELFGEFGWAQIGPTNVNWTCTAPEEHGNKKEYTHPSDVVYYYDDPYIDVRVYVTADLKSYAAGSISKAEIAGAVRSLRNATQCANTSQQFQSKYVFPDDKKWCAHGLLFIYNHDKAWDRDFSQLSADINADAFALARGQTMALFGPEQIEFLHNVASDIQRRRGSGKLPDRKECSFYYPDLVQSKRRPVARALSIEAMTAPWIVQQWRRDGRLHHAIYYRDPGDTTDEFVYLIDYLFRYQRVDDAHEIEVRAVSTTMFGATAFERAKHQYLAAMSQSEKDAFGSRLTNLTYSQIPQYATYFSTDQIGLHRG